MPPGWAGKRNSNWAAGGLASGANKKRADKTSQAGKLATDSMAPKTTPGAPAPLGSQAAKSSSSGPTVARYSQIRHISPPSSFATTSAAGALRASSSITLPPGQVITDSDPSTLDEKTPDCSSLTSLAAFTSTHFVKASKVTAGNELGVGFSSSKYDISKPTRNEHESGAQSASNLRQSLASLAPSGGSRPSNATGSHLNLMRRRPSSSGGGSKQPVSLNYIKTIIILLLGLDLVITVLVHQFSSQDQMGIWFTSHKMRLSLLNLILSGIWFIVLIGGIIFDVHFILAISCLVHLASFLLLFGFSVFHFMRRIDYNTTQPSSLLALLFSIVLLHVYLLVLAALTLYLMRAIRRHRSQRLVVEK